MGEVKLYNYFRSSASYRVRIALHLKGIPYEYIPVHLVNEGGEQFRSRYRELNAMAQVPTLVHDGRILGQSMAILQYLDDVWPTPALFPKDPFTKAQVIQACEIVNSGIQPLQNLSVLNELVARYHLDPQSRQAWAVHWIEKGLSALETLLAKTAGSFAFGGQLTAADVMVVAQMFTSRRFEMDMTPYPTLRRIEANCLKLEAFQKADPARQPDSP